MEDMIKRFSINDSFIGKYEKLITDVVIPYQERAIKDEIPNAEKSHAVHNFELAAKMIETGKCDEEFYGMVFQDSDVAKWIEAASYSLIIKEDKNLEKRIDELIEIIGRAQHKDGYLNSYFTVKEPDKRWTNLQEAHELYCAGHMIEAAVAYFEATGKDSLLKIMMRMGENIYKHFITEKAPGYPGHPEVELALMRLYRVTNDEKYKELAKHFIDVRGVDSDYYNKEASKRNWMVWGMNGDNKEYAQNNVRIREISEACGHAVRAVYLYTGMADVALSTSDEDLKKACHRVWRDIVNKKMYITGGIGSTVHGEAFTKAYDLPNDTAYSETCASIGLIFFARKMLDMELNNEYADVMEIALYNCVLAGMELDGKKFFYVNPLEVVPGISGVVPTQRHDLPERPKWFGCACCPPNIARLITSIANYAWTIKEDMIISHLYIGGELDLIDEQGIKLNVTTNYPYDGNVVYDITSVKYNKERKFAIRLPKWSNETKVKVNENTVYDNTIINSKDNCKVDVKDGYIYITKKFVTGDKIYVNLDLEPVKVYANTLVSSDSGKAAIMRGPLVYCAEGVDNDKDVLGLAFDEKSEISVGEYDEHLLSGIVPLEVAGTRTIKSDELYSTSIPKKENVTINLIPYYTWGNRGLNEMRVWIPVR